MDRPVVAIVGRANVGKSTLFNRISGRRTAIVDELPGTTRDRIYADVSWGGRNFALVDTGGLEPGPESGIGQRVKDQVSIAIEEADVILFMVDARGGISAVDRDITDILRRANKPVVLAVNKVDTPELNVEVNQFYELGIAEPIPLSAYHGIAIDDLLDKVTAGLPPPSAIPAELEMARVAIVGRPNVGKSLLLNALLGEERAIVDEVAGTTRDAIDTIIRYGDEGMVLIDTAGVRRRGRVKPGIERYSVIRALRAINRANVVLLVTDATEFITAQDLHIAGYIQQAYDGMVLIVNKWDLIEEQDVARWTTEIRHKLKFMPYVPILFVSARTGYGVNEVLPAAKRVYEQGSRRLPTPLLNRVIKQAVAEHAASVKGGRQLKIRYVTQPEVSPPTFVFFVNDASLVHFSYRRYLENRLRRAFGFEGNPLRMIFRSKGEEADAR